MSIPSHRDFILAQISAVLGTADPSQGKTHAAKSTKGAAFVLTHLQTAGGVDLLVRRDGDLDAFARISIDWSVPGTWSVRVWDTSADPSADAVATWSLCRPSEGVSQVSVDVRCLAGEWLHPDGGVRSVTDADLEKLTVAAASAPGAGEA